MPRIKKYDLHEVLDGAAQLFWEKGFTATSMSDVVEVTGLNKASLYNEFHDKDGLFEAALEHYSQHIICELPQILVDEPNLKGIHDFLNEIVNMASSEGFNGCLMMNSLVEKGVISKKAEKLIDEFCENLEELLKAAICNAQQNKHISPKKDPDTLANYISCSVHGLILYGKYPEKQQNIPKMHELILSTLIA